MHQHFSCIRYTTALFGVMTLALFLVAPTPTHAANVNEADFEVEVLADGLSIPWAVDWLPDGRMVFTERPGQVNILSADKTIKNIGQLDSSYPGGVESGTMGVLVDPGFATNRYIYVHYTRPSGNRISRFTLSTDEKLTGETPLIDNIPAGIYHDGGRLRLGPDGMAYATTGDATNPGNAQDRNNLAGKVLRFKLDGSIPADNPFGTYIWSWGHRNPQGIVWATNGTLYEAEHGNYGNDEVNIVTKGTNYGWPNVECPGTSNAEYTYPIHCYAEAPSGIAMYNGDLYVAALRGEKLIRIGLSTDGKSVAETQDLFSGRWGRLREVRERGGWLYLTTSNNEGKGGKQGKDQIIRIHLKGVALTTPATTTGTTTGATTTGATTGTATGTTTGATTGATTGTTTTTTGTGVTTTTGTGVTGCAMTTTGWQVPAGFATPVNIFSATKEMMLSVLCNGTGRTTTVTAGSGGSNQYVYKDGYRWTGTKWTKFSYSCTGSTVANKWCVGKATGRFTTTCKAADAYVLAYVCTWAGNAWKCGCNDAACATPNWNILKYQTGACK